jgi:predicted P-loop ATPase
MVASAEDTILAKLFWYQAGGQTSQRQVSDVRGIISVQGSRLEQAYLDKWIETLALGDVWRTVSKP